VFYCTSYETCERQAKLFLNEPIVGFDLEWETFASLKKHGAKQNVSLIQIASESQIGLFHVACFKGTTPEELMPPSLRTLLESESITKTGVNVVGDANRMRTFFQIEMKGLMELSHLYRIVRYSEQSPDMVNFKLCGLAMQVKDVLRLPLKKDETRVSRWSNKLNAQQIEYAAADAYAGFHLYHALENLRIVMDPRPPRPAFYE
ncbi:ribonuclease H-like protein, partial [Dissoconium aciculare CBS 342.82]|uniref:Ribonuclease H-like protein n=1 Tax=Dissoconium aciculare CBS 342.82 TaxID=1314786 RepID=A0A6J3M828_9PEZI